MSAELNRLPGVDGNVLEQLQERLSDARESLLRVLEMIPDAPPERREHLAAQAASAIGMTEADIAAVVLAIEDEEGDIGRLDEDAAGRLPLEVPLSLLRRRADGPGRRWSRRSRPR
ncbi:hypothetical protein [Streptomyces sp. JV178]|uniref:hypothetical protein n=1 Tax=Streptomyces sp. JV178 TaxID=858632 RepID=UPI0015D54BBE|nr:hypothetical protein [Streptomyces sp. JV178]